MIGHDHLVRRRRRVAAAGLESVLEDAHHRTGWCSARVPVAYEQVLDAEPDLERLIGRLRGGRPVSEEGLALARALLVERGSPLFESAAPHTLRRRVRTILDALG